MALYPGAGVAIFIIVRLLLGIAITGGVVYLLVKLAGLADAATKAKKATTVKAT